MLLRQQMFTRGLRRSFWREISTKVRCGRSYWWTAIESDSSSASQSVHQSVTHSLNQSAILLPNRQRSACALPTKVRCLSLSFLLKVPEQLPLSQLLPLNYAPKPLPHLVIMQLPHATCHTHRLPKNAANQRVHIVRTHPKRQPPASIATQPDLTNNSSTLQSVPQVYRLTPRMPRHRGLIKHAAIDSTQSTCASVYACGLRWILHKLSSCASFSNLSICWCSTILDCVCRQAARDQVLETLSYPINIQKCSILLGDWA